MTPDRLWRSNQGYGYLWACIVMQVSKEITDQKRTDESPRGGLPVSIGVTILEGSSKYGDILKDIKDINETASQYSSSDTEHYSDGGYSSDETNGPV